MQLVAFWIELNIKHEAQRPIPVHKNSAPRSAAEQALKDIKADPELMERVGSATDDTHDSMIRLEHFLHFVCKKYVKNRQSSVALVHIWLVSVFSGDCVSNLPGLDVFERPRKANRTGKPGGKGQKFKAEAGAEGEGGLAVARKDGIGHLGCSLHIDLWSFVPNIRPNRTECWFTVKRYCG